MHVSLGSSEPVIRQVERGMGLRRAEDIFAAAFGLTAKRGAFIAAVFWSGDRGRSGPEITRQYAVGREAVRSAYVRTRELGVETDGERYFLTPELRARCRAALDADRRGNG